MRTQTVASNRSISGAYMDMCSRCDITAEKQSCRKGKQGRQTRELKKRETQQRSEAYRTTHVRTVIVFGAWVCFAITGAPRKPLARQVGERVVVEGVTHPGYKRARWSTTDGLVGNGAVVACVV